MDILAGMPEPLAEKVEAKYPGARVGMVSDDEYQDILKMTADYEEGASR